MSDSSIGRRASDAEAGCLHQPPNRKIPAFDFGVDPMRVSSADFLACYHERNESGGHIVDMGNGTETAQVNNPQTLTAGRQVLLGNAARF
jgi:hypothetical protein